MSEKAKEEKLAAMSQVNPFEFGYKPGTGITIPAEIFMALLEYTQVVSKNETKEFIEFVSFNMGEQPVENEKKVIRVVTTPIGQRSEEIFNMLMEIQFENIDKGLAVSYTKPQLDLGPETE